METESDSAIPFLDVLDIGKETTLAAKVQRKPTHTDRYLIFNSNCPPHMKRGFIQRLHKRASEIHANETTTCVMKLAASDAIFS
jgi:hypothetical protein